MSEPLAFVSVREIYPNVGNEVLAFRAWLEALRDDSSMKILEGTKRWNAYWLDAGTAPAFIPSLARFLRDRRYRISPDPKRKSWEPKPISSRRFTAQEADEPRISKPIAPEPLPVYEAPRGFRTAAEILAEYGRHAARSVPTPVKS